MLANQAKIKVDPSQHFHWLCLILLCQLVVVNKGLNREMLADDLTDFLESFFHTILARTSGNLFSQLRKRIEH